MPKIYLLEPNLYNIQIKVLTCVLQVAASSWRASWDPERLWSSPSPACQKAEGPERLWNASHQACQKAGGQAWPPKRMDWEHTHCINTSHDYVILYLYFLFLLFFSLEFVLHASFGSFSRVLQIYPGSYASPNFETIWSTAYVEYFCWVNKWMNSWILKKHPWEASSSH